MKSYSRKWEEKEKEPFTFLTIRKRIVYDENATPRFVYKVAPFPKKSITSPNSLHTHTRTESNQSNYTKAEEEEKKKKTSQQAVESPALPTRYYNIRVSLTSIIAVYNFRVSNSLLVLLPINRRKV